MKMSLKLFILLQCQEKFSQNTKFLLARRAYINIQHVQNLENLEKIVQNCSFKNSSKNGWNVVLSFLSYVRRTSFSLCYVLSLHAFACTLFHAERAGDIFFVGVKFKKSFFFFRKNVFLIFFFIASPISSICAI